MNSDSNIAAPDDTSSPVAWAMRRMPTSSPYPLTPRSSAFLSPASCVPPSGVGMAESILLVIGPSHRPFDAAAFGEIHPAEERPRRQRRSALKGGGEKVAE